MTSIHNILDTCGIDYEWTDKEEEGIVFLDFGSRSIKDQSLYSKVRKHI